MNYLLVAATPFEIAPTVELIKQKKIKVDVLIAGIGMLATAYHLTRKLAEKKYDFVIQAGIAGCFDKDFQLGDVVIVKDEIVGDLGVKEKKEYKDLFDMNFLKPNDFPYSSKVLKNKNKDALKLLKLPRVSGVTVNQITTAKPVIDLYVRKYNAVVESMEGAALHYICSQEKTPFLQLRSISNYVGERNKSKWKIKEAIVNLNEEVVRVLSSEF
ncbi:futalosine hydrolase [Pinibacter soli]|uniref:Futalosine hydrolase n=1 Tax=Pinibacter soli TaxID=3044211 RepID=A0ABT6RBZ4_9BACT|nr:futalosine hydrolase [Pinibacter soli]MDI3320050.1 futalosine hydrolase [Pinibacter soli]